MLDQYSQYTKLYILYQLLTINDNMMPQDDLDIEYFELRQKITNNSFLAATSRHHRIRLNNWILKLDKIKSNALWKKNRNNYAKLLNLACMCETIIQPFNNLPPSHDLPKLTKYQINCMIDLIERSLKSTKVPSNTHQGSSATYQEQESSYYMRRFIDIVNKSQNYKQKEVKECEGIIRYHEDSFKKKQNQSILEEKQNVNFELAANLFQLKYQQKINKNKSSSVGKTIASKLPQKPPKYFNKNIRLKTEESSSFQQNIFHKQHQLQQELSFENKNIQNQFRNNQSSLFSEECNFNQEICQREYFVESLNSKQYFSWKNHIKTNKLSSNKSRQVKIIIKTKTPSRQGSKTLTKFMTPSDSQAIASQIPTQYEKPHDSEPIRPNIQKQYWESHSDTLQLPSYDQNFHVQSTLQVQDSLELYEHRKHEYNQKVSKQYVEVDDRYNLRQITKYINNLSF